jgi:hypothetical protein
MADGGSRIGWTVAAVSAACIAGLLYLLGAQMRAKGAGGWLIAFVCLVAVLTALASILVQDDEAIRKRNLGALLELRSISMLFLAVGAGLGMVTMILDLVEPTPTSSPPPPPPAPPSSRQPRIKSEIQDFWGEPGCAVVYRFVIRDRALIIDRVRRPLGAPALHRVATIILAEGDVLDVRGEEDAPGQAATFTYVTNGVTERLYWNDQALRSIEELLPCPG